MNKKLLILSVGFLAVVALFSFLSLGHFEPSVGAKLGGWTDCGWTEDEVTKPYGQCDYVLNPIFRTTHVEAPTHTEISSNDCSVHVERFEDSANYHWLTCDIGFGGPDWKVLEGYNGIVIWLLPNGILISL